MVLVGCCCAFRTKKKCGPRFGSRSLSRSTAQGFQSCAHCTASPMLLAQSVQTFTALHRLVGRKWMEMVLSSPCHVAGQRAPRRMNWASNEENRTFDESPPQGVGLCLTSHEFLASRSLVAQGFATGSKSPKNSTISPSLQTPASASVRLGS